MDVRVCDHNVSDLPSCESREAENQEDKGVGRSGSHNCYVGRFEKCILCKARAIIAVKEKYIQILGTALTFVYGLFIVMLYVSEPRSLAEVPGKARTTIENAATTGQVLAGTYDIDKVKFDEGLRAFRQDNFVAARDLFDRADPQKRDARTQFYIAYSFYRQGWGRVSNDDALFKQGLEAADRARMIDRDFRADDPQLKLRTPAELRNELEEGLKVTADDFNPLKVLRERK
jgi:hypothetical protein